MSDMRRSLGPLGIWAIELRFADPGFVAEAAAELEELGYGTLWFPGGHGGPVLENIDLLHSATRRAVIATGILNIWTHEPAELGGWWRGLDDARRSRVMLGLGVGHAAAIGESWKHPLSKMRGYLEALEAEGLPAEHLCLAALGPKMVELARDRTAGSHPYLITPEFTGSSRDRLGADALLAPEQGVILDTHPSSARAKAREHLQTYIDRPNYRNSWLRQGFSEDDLNQRCDRLIDAIFAWGSTEQIAARVKAHRDAGADHVCLQVIPGASGVGGPEALRRTWRELAAIAA